MDIGGAASEGDEEKVMWVWRRGLGTTQSRSFRFWTHRALAQLMADTAFQRWH